MIYIVIPVHDRLHFTINCLDSLFNQTYKAYTIIVVNDGSKDNTGAHLSKHYPKVIQLHGDGNLWWAGATNLGVKHALELSNSANDFILTLNNDLVVKDNYLESLLDVAKEHSSALIGSVSVFINEPDKVHFAGTHWNSKTAKYRSTLTKDISYKSLIDSSSVINTDLLPGRGILIPKKVFKEIGLYDHVTFPHYMADEDFSLRAIKAKYKLIIAVKAVVYNHVNESGLENQKHNLKYYKDVFTSVKSPVNPLYRWNWAKRHASIFPPVYFMVDTLRVIKGLIFK